MSRRSPLLLGTIGAVVALGAAIGAGAIVQAVDAGPKEPKPEVNLKFDASDDESGTDDLIGGDPTGKAAPEVSFALLDGGSTKLSAFRGTPVVLNFWATTCAPCIKEMPAIESVHQDLGDRVTFIGMDVRDSVSGGKEFVERTGVTYAIGRDASGDVFTSFDAVNLPTTVLIDAQGSVVATHTGALDAEALRSTSSSSSPMKNDRYAGSIGNPHGFTAATNPAVNAYAKETPFTCGSSAAGVASASEQPAVERGDARP